MEHHTSNRVSVSKHCRKCEKVTAHRVNGNHTVGHCLCCLYKLDPRILSRDELSVLGTTENQRKLDIWARQAKPVAPVQEELFA